MAGRDGSDSGQAGQLLSVALTDTQVRILVAVAAGETNEAIARSLYISAATVRYHLTRIQRSLRVGNRAALVAAAIVGGVLSGETWPVRETGSVIVVIP